MPSAKIALLLLPLLLAGQSCSAADEDEDEAEQDEARHAVESGAARPLDEILSQPVLRGAGVIVRVKLKREHGWRPRIRPRTPSAHHSGASRASGRPTMLLRVWSGDIADGPRMYRNERSNTRQ